MKKIFYSILLFSGLCLAANSCSNGVYTANPAGSANNSVNPLKPLTSSQFTWANTGVVSGDVNGVHFSADTAGWFLDSSGTNIITGLSGGKGFVFLLNNVYAVNLYSLSYDVFNTQVAWTDTFGNLNDYYYSYYGNSGEVKITENDSAYIKGLFYFQGVTKDGRLVTVSNGSFNIAKPVVP
jgi:hypothetical protein